MTEAEKKRMEEERQRKIEQTKRENEQLSSEETQTGKKKGSFFQRARKSFEEFGKKLISEESDEENR